MKKLALIMMFLSMFAATTAMAVDNKIMLMLLGGFSDTISYVYFGADRVVFGTDPITI